MPDPVRMAVSLALAAVVAGAVVGLLRLVRRDPSGPLLGIGLILGLSLGLVVGWWWLGVRVRWPPREDQDRLLLIVFPMLIAIELASAGLAGVRRWVWVPRLLLAGAATPILLRNTTYLADLAGPGSRQWSSLQIALNLGVAAVTFAGVWWLTSWLMHRTQSRAPVWILVGVNLGTAATVMLSGYASGGQLGLPVAGALAGVLLAGLLVPELDCDPAVSVGITGAVSLAVIGHFFGELTVTNAALLVFAPLAAWLVEVPQARPIPGWIRNGAGVALAAIPVAIALFLAQADFAADSKPVRQGEAAPSIDDYKNFGQ